ACIAFGVSRQTWYKWKRRYNAYGIDRLKDQSKRPHNIKNVKIIKELEKIILELRLNNRFGPMRIRFRLIWYIIRKPVKILFIYNNNNLTLTIFTFILSKNV